MVLTPLSLAAFAGQQEIVSILVEAGATINAADKVSEALSMVTLYQLLSFSVSWTLYSSLYSLFILDSVSSAVLCRDGRGHGNGGVLPEAK